jgi:lysophospholipid acyltransferase (LPLAT)-like uncharacterized protein
MPSFKSIVTSSAFQSAVGAAGAWYLQLVWYTSRATYEPADIYRTVKFPAIIAMWHGQHFLAPFIKRNDDSHRAKVLVSRHRDGEINARAASRLGIGIIRGSGAHNGEFHRKGGASAFTEMPMRLTKVIMSHSPPTSRRSRASPGWASSSWRSIPAGRSTR